MSEISLKMVGKRLEEIQGDIKAVHGDVATLTQKVDGMAQTLIDVRRDVRSLQGEVATLGAAVAGHSRRLERIESSLNLHDAE